MQLKLMLNSRYAADASAMASPCPEPVATTVTNGDTNGPWFRCMESAY